MGKMKELAQDMADIFSEGIITEKSNRYGQVMLLMNSARHHRQERLITICAWHYDDAWWDGLEWVTDRPIPPGRQTHGICPDCMPKLMRDKIVDVNLEKAMENLKMALRNVTFSDLEMPKIKELRMRIQLAIIELEDIIYPPKRAGE